MSNKKIDIQEDGCNINGTWYSRDSLYQMYIIDNMSQTNFAAALSVSRGTVISLVNYFKLFKGASVVKQNRANAIKDKYGVDSVMLVPEIRQKSQNSIIQKYGSKTPLTATAVKEKTQKTMLKKYGVEYPSQSRDIINKKQQNSVKKNGVPSHKQINISNFEIWNNDDSFREFLINVTCKPTYLQLASFFNVDRTAVSKKVHDLGLCDFITTRPGYSSYEQEIVDMLIFELNIPAEDIQRNVVGLLGDSKQEIDIYLPGYKIGIEFNGDYWHSDIFHNDHSGRSKYHQQKSLLAEKNDIFLFHIFEYEWNNKIERLNIKNRLMSLLQKDQQRIAARKCIVKEISKEQKKNFLDINHIQGNDHSSVYIGLFYNDELISCMTFVKSKHAKYTWELSRFCSKHGTCIQGGASKLFSYFLRTLSSGNTVCSYNDISKTKGTVYETLGFTLASVNDPNYIWMNFTTHDIRTRYQEQAAKENERMQKAGYHKICDCGTKTWVYTVI